MSIDQWKFDLKSYLKATIFNSVFLLVVSYFIVGAISGNWWGLELFKILGLILMGFVLLSFLLSLNYKSRGTMEFVYVLFSLTMMEMQPDDNEIRKHN